ncbi:uncharacterized protein LOC118424289 [Branchiostoma floridae]|uniref:Uncharacterized protein LOC118424289 n=1 Tax=Branchiostoma floridae TaxID=7739 RepID=A0A9J7LUA4_BRAFL|nr:uncharacterized protein LOC118424289 [Branchiostoma floridae]XP_035688728.1 uncharacterized protein LOC118424289 [Branchiostoma floridae]
MAYRRLLELQESHQLFRAPSPPPDPNTVNKVLLALERETRNLQQEASQDREVRRHRPQRPPVNNKNRYSRTSPTDEERHRALDQHAERLYHRKLQTQMFGEDLSTSKLPTKKQGKKVRAQEKLQQIKEEHLNTVPYRHEHQRLRMARTTAMFGKDLSRKSSTRRAPAQPSLVGVQSSEGMMGEERRQYRMYPDDDEETVYVTLEERRPHRRKQTAATDSEKTATKLPSLTPQRHSLTGKRTAADTTVSDRPLLMKDPKPPVAAKSDNNMAAEKLNTKKRASHRRTRDSRALKRRCESPSGPVRSKH